MRVTYGEMAATVDKIEKINERAARREFTGRLAVECTEVIEKRRDALGFEIEETLYDVVVTGEPPSYNGWTLAAVLDWDAEAGLIVRTAPGVDRVDRDGLREGWCDHCAMLRQRNSTYLVRNGAGEQRQVGSTCIKDFLGWSGNVVFYSASEAQDEIDGMLAGGGHLDRRWSVETVLAVAWAASQAFGYVPASSYDGTPTKSIVLTVLSPNPRSAGDRELVEGLRPYVQRSAEQAGIVRDWVLGEGFSGDGEYTLNLKAVAGAESVGSRNVGLLASAPQAWARAMERDLIRRAEREELISEHVGQPKDKLDLTVRITSIRYIPGDYGTTTLYTLVSDDHRVFKWFSTSAALGETADDTLYKIRGTVKGHDEYGGMKSTVLTRCKVIS